MFLLNDWIANKCVNLQLFFDQYVSVYHLTKWDNFETDDTMGTKRFLKPIYQIIFNT